MRSILLLPLLALILAASASTSRAATYGPYTTYPNSTVSSIPSNTRVELGIGPDALYHPIVLDNLGYQVIDCVIGCSGSGGGGAAVAPYSGTSSACSATTIGTTPTLLLDTAANAGRAGGGLVYYATGTANIVYRWALPGETGGQNLTTTPSGANVALTPNSQLPFTGAPSGQLWAVSTANQTAFSCFAVK